jgi:hypothetical protein
MGLIQRLAARGQRAIDRRQDVLGPHRRLEPPQRLLHGDQAFCSIVDG